MARNNKNVNRAMKIVKNVREVIIINVLNAKEVNYFIMEHAYHVILIAKIIMLMEDSVKRNVAKENDYQQKYNVMMEIL